MTTKVDLPLRVRVRQLPSRIVRLDSLDPVTADIVRAILTARANAAKAAESGGQAA